MGCRITKSEIGADVYRVARLASREAPTEQKSPVDRNEQLVESWEIQASRRGFSMVLSICRSISISSHRNPRPVIRSHSFNPCLPCSRQSPSFIL